MSLKFILGLTCLCIHAGAWFSFCLSARVLNSNLNLNSNGLELIRNRKAKEIEK